jgi:serine/threonine protein kinase
MAETFEATRAGAGGFEQRVCLKRMLPAFGEDDEFVSQFEREAKLAAQLRHTNIVGVVDFGRVDGVQYMTLELVDGVDLRSLLKSTPGEWLAPETVALIALDLGHALEHAHRTLVHRDISPSNILVSRTGEAKLADFGIAKAIENAKVTASRSAKGKVPYMCPEHMRGEAIDGRADLFSLGVVLFEAVAGVRPFDGAHDVETMQKILDGDRVLLCEVAPHVPEELRLIIERLIEVDPNQRTPTAAAMIEELVVVAPHPSVRRELAATVEGHRGGPRARLHVRAREEERDTDLSRPIGLGAVPAPNVGRPPARRRWALAAAIALGLASAAIGLAWMQRGSTPLESTQSPALGEAPLEAPSPTPSKSTAPPGTPTPSELAIDEAPARAPVRARASKGWLHVVVEPWGNVWIDDVWMGRAPVKARLPKGRHVVKVGRELPTKTRVVRVEAGARKEVELRLID